MINYVKCGYAAAELVDWFREIEGIGNKIHDESLRLMFQSLLVGNTFRRDRIGEGLYKLSEASHKARVEACRKITEKHSLTRAEIAVVQDRAVEMLSADRETMQ